MCRIYVFVVIVITLQPSFFLQRENKCVVIYTCICLVYRNHTKYGLTFCLEDENSTWNGSYHGLVIHLHFPQIKCEVSFSVLHQVLDLLLMIKKNQKYLTVSNLPSLIFTLWEQRWCRKLSSFGLRRKRYGVRFTVSPLFGDWLSPVAIWLKYVTKAK